MNKKHLVIISIFLAITSLSLFLVLRTHFPKITKAIESSPFQPVSMVTNYLYQSMNQPFETYIGSGIQEAEEEDVSLEILNPYSHPKKGENWVVKFKTTGKADLTITPQDQATINDLEFVSLKCGDEVRNPQIKENDTIFYSNWKCSETGSLTYLVNFAGQHTLKFQFGDQVAFAYNDPGNIFTNSPALLDFEEGNLNDWDTTAAEGAGAAISASTTQKYEGSYSSHAYMENFSPDNMARAYGGKAVSWPAGNVGYLHFYIYVEATGSGQYGSVGRLGGFVHNYYDPNNYPTAILTILDTGKWRAWLRTGDGYMEGESAGDTTVISEDEWHEVQICYDISGTDAKMQVWIDGNEEINYTATGSGKPSSGPAQIVLGGWSINSGEYEQWIDSYYDDIQAESEKIGGIGKRVKGGVRINGGVRIK